MSDLDDYFDQVGYFTEPGSGAVDVTPTRLWQAYWQRIAEAWCEAGDPVAGLAARQGFVVRAAQAAELGVTRSRTRWLTAHDRWQTPTLGVLAPLDVRLDAPWRPDATAATADTWVVGRRRMAVRASAAALRNRDHVVSGRSGAVLHGLPTFRDPDQPVLTAAPTSTLGRRGAVHARGAGLTAADVQSWFGTGVTTPARTVVDLARLDRWDGVIAADAALHNESVTLAQLRAATGRARGWPGVRQAREIVEFADARAESPLESITRLRLHDDGFPPPELQFDIPVAGRRRPYRVDFLWPQQRLILEVDGALKYRGASAWDEKGRHIALRKFGYRIERLRWFDVVEDWPSARRLLWDALRSSSPTQWS